MKTTDVHLDAAGDRLLCREGVVQLPWRVARFLQMLDEARGELVSRERAQAELWGDVVVTRNSFDQLMTQTRRCLEEAGIDPALLETVPRQGCRLKVRFAPASATSRRSRARLAGSIALLTMAAALAWHFWPAADYVCRVQAAPVNAADGGRVMHLFFDVEVFEAFHRAQETAGNTVEAEGELRLDSEATVIVCVET